MLTIPIYDIPSQGIRVVVDDPAVFAAPIAEFGMDCRVCTPLRAEYTLIAVDGGCLLRGTLTGVVLVPCDRCVEDCPLEIRHTVETFVPFPNHTSQSDATEAAEADDASHHVYIDNGVAMLNLAALSWEEFMLALPHRPLCANNCKGLCTHCGANLNTASCTCVDTGTDPRLAVLRSLHISKDAPKN